MVMTTQRRTKAAAGKRKSGGEFPGTGLPCRYAPPTIDIVGEAAFVAFEAAKAEDVMADPKGLAGLAFGIAAATQFELHALVEHAFERITQLETALRGEKRQTATIQKSAAAGFSLDDLNVEQVDDRRCRLILRQGDQEASFELKFPSIIDRGIWSDRAAYERGDAVSFSGSLWIAQKDAPGKPDTAEGAWRLAVKRGRDGKDLRA